MYLVLGLLQEGTALGFEKLHPSRRFKRAFLQF